MRSNNNFSVNMQKLFKRRSLTKYPEVMRVDGMGNRNRHGLRHNHCMSSEISREKVRLIDRKLIEAVGDHPGLLM